MIFKNSTNVNINLNSELLNTSGLSEDYYGIQNANGLYKTIQFVIRLRNDVHYHLNEYVKQNITSESIQAFSTYFHETIHWWQHIGSIHGFISSMSFPTQIHINKKLLDDYLKFTGPIKSIYKYNSLNAKILHPSDDEFKTINQIINNYNDIKYYKQLNFDPIYYGDKVVNDIMFESLGHSFNITNGSFLSLLANEFDKESKYFPNIEKWDEQFRILKNKKIDGFYYGGKLILPPLGIKEILEGQASFCQMQYLYYFNHKNFTLQDFKKQGLYHGVYTKAFETYLLILNEKEPEKLDDPLINLFLLICDLSINPMEGFVFDFENFENAIYITNPGIRFLMICNLIKNELPELKTTIKDCSNSEYIYVSEIISNKLSYKSVMLGLSEIVRWRKENPLIVKLMEEEKIYKYEVTNLPIRLMFSKFIKYSEDKLNKPAFFCWPAFYITDKNHVESVIDLFNEHETLFVDDLDGDIYPRILPNKPEENIQSTFANFYAWVISYDLVKQWIEDDGDFEYQYNWLTTKFDKYEMKVYTDTIFKSLFHIEPDKFKTC